MTRVRMFAVRRSCISLGSFSVDILRGDGGPDWESSSASDSYWESFAEVNFRDDRSECSRPAEDIGRFPLPIGARQLLLDHSLLDNFEVVGLRMSV